MSPSPLDGNAPAGDFSDIFAIDVTTAITTCSACRHTHPVGALHAYLHTPGIVLRCAACDAVQIRLVRSSERAWLDLSGIAVLETCVTLAGDNVTGNVSPTDGTGS